MTSRLIAPAAAVLVALATRPADAQRAARPARTPAAAVQQSASSAPRAASTTAPLLVAASPGSVAILVGRPGPGGFVVYRREGAAAFARLTTEPVRAEVDPQRAEATLGADLPDVERALGATSAVQVTRRLERDPFAGGILALTHPAVARVRGQLFVDSTVRGGTAYEYRVVAVDGAGKETDRAWTVAARAADLPPAPPTAVVAAPHGHDIDLTWSYEPFHGDPSDAAVAFHVYRSDPAAPTPRLVTTIIRLDGAPRHWRDGDVYPGATYRYTLRAVDFAGHEGAPSAEAVVAMRDATPLSAPADVVARPGDGSITLVWRMSPEARVAGYRIERASSLTGPYTRAARGLVPAAQPLWTDSSAAGGDRWFYRVYAVDSAGVASAPSAATPAVAEDHTPPAPPSGLAATVVKHLARIAWHASPSPDVKGYYVYRGDDSTALARITTVPIAATQLVDTGFDARGLVPGHRYAIRVTAIDRSYNESRGVTTTVTIPDDEPPLPATGLRLTNARGRWVDIAWTSSPSPDVARYELRRGESGAAPSGPSVVVATRTRASALAFRDTAVAHGRVYRYALVAYDSAGNASAAVSDTVRFAAVVPPPPSRFVGARTERGGVAVRWEPVVAPELVGYHVYRGASPTGAFTRITRAPVAGTSFVDPAPIAGAFYSVRAIDASGNESRLAPAARAVADTTGAAPAAPATKPVAPRRRTARSPKP